MTKPTFICCKDFLLLFKEETVILCWAALMSLLTESQIYLTLSYFLHLGAYFYFVMITYYVLDKFIPIKIITMTSFCVI